MGEDYINRAAELFKDNKPLRQHSESTFQVLAKLINEYNPKNPLDIKLKDISAVKDKNNVHDMIISIEVIERVHNPRRLLKLMHRILEDNGRLILTVTNNQNWFARLIYLFKGSFPVFPNLDSSRVLPCFLWQIRALTRDIFDIEKITYNRSVIPLIRLRIPFKSLLFGENVILVLKKK
jgi:SAM-dependent methyltransferase